LALSGEPSHSPLLLSYFAFTAYHSSLIEKLPLLEFFSERFEHAFEVAPFENVLEAFALFHHVLEAISFHNFFGVELVEKVIIPTIPTSIIPTLSRKLVEVELCSRDCDH
jgi:hypothetical protein